jgi:Mce-associated membrane protein
LSRRDPVRDGLAVLTVLAVLATGWLGWAWWRAAHDDGLALARDRDAVLAVAGDGLVC